jgi:hypothetical protein
MENKETIFFKQVRTLKEADESQVISKQVCFQAIFSLLLSHSKVRLW